MTGSRKRNTDNEQIDTLTGEVGRLADEVRVLRDAVDELREKLWHGILNDKFPRCVADDDVELADGSGMDADVRKDLQDAVRQQIRNEMAGLTDTLNDFSLDLQFVLRQARDEGFGSVAQLTDQPCLCCENPQLAWRGSRENAAVSCQSCGFVLSDDGQLIDWHDPEEKENYREYLKEEAQRAQDHPAETNPENSDEPATSSKPIRQPFLFAPDA